MEKRMLKNLFVFVFVIFFAVLVFAVTSFVINSPLNQTYTTNEITFNVTVTDSDGVDTCIYHLGGANSTLERASVFVKGGYTGFSFDVATISLLTNNPLGITMNETFFWVTDSAYDEVFQFYANGTYTNHSFDIAADGLSNPRGITNNGTFFWITDIDTEEVYKFYMNGTYTQDHFDTLIVGNENPVGITMNETFFWITSNLNIDEVFQYYVNGTYTNHSFDTTVAGMVDTRHITNNGTFFWISGSTSDTIFEFYMNGTYTGFNFSVTSSGNTNPFGLTLNSTHIFVVSNLEDRVYSHWLYDNYLDFYNSTNSSVPDGFYDLFIYCNDTLGNGVWNTSISFSVDTTSPSVTITSPGSGQSVTGSSLDLSVTTNENSTCNYSLNAGAANSSLTSNSAGTTHTETLSGLTDGSYILNIYCMDINGNTNHTMNNSFSVSIPSSLTRQEGSSLTMGISKFSLTSGNVYRKLIKSGDKFEISLEDESLIVEIEEINNLDKKIVFSISEEEYSAVENESIKIDSDSDGYYDLEVLVSEIRSDVYSLIEFKEITEEVGAEEKETVDENIGVGEKNGNNFWSYSLVIIVVLGIVFYFWKLKK